MLRGSFWQRPGREHGTGAFRSPRPWGLDGAAGQPGNLHFIADEIPPVDPATIWKVAVRLGNVYAVVGLNPLDKTQIAAYIGSSKTVTRLLASDHPAKDYLKGRETAIFSWRVFGNLDVAATDRKTEGSASKQALGSPETYVIAEVKMMVDQINKGEEPAPAKTKMTEFVRQQMLNLKAQIAGKAAPVDLRNRMPPVSRPAKYWARHDVEMRGDPTVVKASGEPFSTKLLSRALSIVNILGLLSTARDARMAWQGIVETNVAWPCEDKGGIFLFHAVPHGLYETPTAVYGSWFFADTYYKHYIDGPLRGRKVPSSRDEVDLYRKELKNLYGYVNWAGDFVPGLLMPEPLPMQVDMRA